MTRGTSKPNRTTANVTQHLAGPIERDARRNLDRLLALPDVVRAAVLPDIHAAGNVCVGLALATESRIYPEAAGSDVGCGILAVPIDDSPEVNPNDPRLYEAVALLRTAVPIHRRRSTDIIPLPSKLLHAPLSDPRLEANRRKTAAAQLGTLGHGNHFLELTWADCDARLWLVIHTGSRGIGQAITNLHRANANPDTSLGWLNANSDAGQRYINDTAWACRYASANRRAIAKAAAEILTPTFGSSLDWSSAIETTHDFVRRERHNGQALWIHRKGVQPLSENARGILPSSMGGDTLLIRGRNTSSTLASVSHGCGRILSRKQAAESLHPVFIRRALQDLVTPAADPAAFATEAPQAFRRLRNVTKAQRNLLRTTDRLTPLLCYKAAR